MTTERVYSLGISTTPAGTTAAFDVVAVRDNKKGQSTFTANGQVNLQKLSNRLGTSTVALTAALDAQISKATRA